MDIFDALAKIAADMIQTGQAVAAGELLVIVYLVRQLAQAQVREQKRIDQTITSAEENVKALGPIAGAMVSGTEVMRRTEEHVEEITRAVSQIDGKLDRLLDRQKP